MGRKAYDLCIWKLERSGGSSTNMPSYDGGVYMEDNMVNGTSGTRTKRGEVMWVGQPVLDFSTIGDVLDTYDFIKQM